MFLPASLYLPVSSVTKSSNSLYNLSIASSCQVKATGGSYVNAACTYATGVLAVTIPAATTFASGTENYVSLNGILTTPTTNNGTYLFDVTSYQATTIIESWTAPLTITAAPFTSPSATSLVIGAGLRTVLTFTYTASVNIDAGVPQTTTNTTKGVLEFEFSGVANDLGTGQSSRASIPCKPQSAAITPTSGTLNCYLIPGANPVIRVDNFPAISAGSQIIIAFPKLSNPSPAPAGGTISIRVKAYRVKNRIRTELNTASLTVPCIAAVARTYISSCCALILL